MMVCGQAGGRTYRHNNLSPTAYFFTAGFLASSLCVSLCSAPLNCKKPISAVLQCNVCTDFASLPPPSQALTSYCLFIPPLHRMLDDRDWDEEHEVLGRWFTRRELALLLAFLTFTSLFTAYFLVRGARSPGSLVHPPRARPPPRLPHPHLALHGLLPRPSARWAEPQVLRGGGGSPTSPLPHRPRDHRRLVPPRRWLVLRAPPHRLRRRHPRLAVRSCPWAAAGRLRGAKGGSLSTQRARRPDTTL